MTLLLTRLPILESQQFNLPGIPEFLLAAGWEPEPVEDVLDDPPPVAPGPGQLHFGASQEPLSEPAAPAVQLPLLPDPPVWEAEPAARPKREPRKGRLARKRDKLKLSPGQMSLF